VGRKGNDLAILSSFTTTVLAFVFVLGFLIFIHELGHFLVARYFGIRVEVFSLGFGRRLWGVKRGETDYRISLVPLGGYVRMSGENPDEALTGSPDEFLSRSKPERFFVAVAGPAMNIGLAVLLLTTVYIYGQEVPEYQSGPAILGAIETGSPASQSGLLEGDTILSLNQKPTPTWKEANFKIRVNGSRQVSVSYLRGSSILHTTVTPVTSPDGGGSIGVTPHIPFLVSDILPESAAHRAGIKKGDLILTASKGDLTGRGFYSILQLIQSSENQPLQIEILRNENILKMSATPQWTDEGPKLGAYVEFKRTTEKFGVAESIQKSIQECSSMAKLTFVTIGRLITGSSSIKQLSGPIEIAKYSGQAASLGLIPLVLLMAIISLQLGLFNLLPIPVLDGGLIALLAIEGLMGRDLSMAVKERIFKVGFVFLILVMGFVIFNDLAKNLPEF
jgi:regulator of sigma E protease